jgi:AcrR family transcriptional regulator
VLRTQEVEWSLLPPRAASDGTLRRVQEEALVRFADRGYHGVSMRDIADACGIKASSIYAHVRSKAELLSGLALIAHEEHRDRLSAALLNSGSDPTDQLRALVLAHARFHAEYPILATVANNELHALPDEIAATVQSHRDEGVRMFMEVIERGVKLGQFNCDEPVLVTAAIAAMGIRLAAWYRPDGQEGTDGYATRVWKLFGTLGKSYTIDEIAERYAEFALKLVS